jgi:hypothetical protein
VPDLDVKVVPQKDKRLGRQKVHDPVSRGWPLSFTLDREHWRTKSVRLYDPWPNLNQCHGECTGVAKSMEFNAVGNRRKGHVLKMDDAHKIYSLASLKFDPWDGGWPPEDTGSSGLAAAKAAQQLGLGGSYRHVFRGADEVVQLIQQGRAVNVGTWWTWGMFEPDEDGIIEPTGGMAGGHQYLARGYDLDRDLVKLRCWWGWYRDVWIRRDHLNDLLMDDGDAHVQDRKLI